MASVGDVVNQFVSPCGWKITGILGWISATRELGSVVMIENE